MKHSKIHQANCKFITISIAFWLIQYPIIIVWNYVGFYAVKWYARTNEYVMYIRTYLLLSQRKSAMSAQELKCIFGWVIRTSTANNSLSLPHLSLMEGLEGGRVTVGPPHTMDCNEVCVSIIAAWWWKNINHFMANWYNTLILT